MGMCTTTTKICLLLITVVFWTAAGALCFVGGWVFQTYNDFKHLTEATLTLVPAGCMLAIAVFMFFVGLLGCLAVCKESKVLLSAYFSLIIIILIGEIAAGTLAYVYRKEVKHAVHDEMKQAIHHYNDTTMREQVDFLQSQYHCCGIMNASDWNTTDFFKNHDHTVPVSCCKLQNDTASCSRKIGARDINSGGCLMLLQNKFTTNLVYIASIVIAFAVLQIVGLLSACILVCRSRDVYERFDNGLGSGMTV